MQQQVHQQDPTAAALAHTPAPPAVAIDGEITAVSLRRAVAGRSAVVRGLEALSFHVARVTALLSLLMTMVMISCLLVQVFFRYVIGDPLAWTDEAAIFFFAWTTLLLASIGVRDRTHVRFTFLVDILPRRVVEVLDLAMMALIAAFGVVFITTGQELVDLVWDNLSPAIHYPVQYLYIAIPVVGGLFVLHAVTNLVVGPLRPPATPAAPTAATGATP